MSGIQITDAEIPKFRKMFATKNKYKCPICGTTLVGTTTVLDHCHKTGKLRDTICGTCNVSEGKIRVNMRYRARKSHMVHQNPAEFLRRLADYWDKHENSKCAYIHPTFDMKKGCQKPTKRK